MALFSIVVILHLTNFLNQKLAAHQLIRGEYAQQVITNAGNGMALFFMISAFILALPFAKWRLLGEQKPGLKHFYLRRLIRLEPPYLIALIIFLIAHLTVFHKYSPDQLLRHFLASAVYLHGIIYHSFSIILPVAWSLEVEVQFYLLAPIFFLLLRIKPVIIRRVLIVALIIASLVFTFGSKGVPSVLNYLQYFFSGILLADLFVSKWKAVKNTAMGFVIALCCALVYYFVLPVSPLWDYLLRNAAMICFFHLLLTNKWLKKIFSFPAIATIGGMGYSIYLMHFGVLAALDYLLKKWGVVEATVPATIVLGVIFLFVILLVSFAYYIMIERPFMAMARRKVGR